ncbi:hypothetical protein EDB80DRAFT_820494 [Ilyonectria destructans]|nr:hypothetical protein EDB80DRAFT_820494 [Ilyonectria destructans]
MASKSIRENTDNDLQGERGFQISVSMNQFQHTEYVTAAIEYATALKRWPPFMRPIVYRLLPEHGAMFKQLAEGGDMIKGMFDEYRDQESRGDVELPPPVLYLLSRDPKEQTGSHLEKQIQRQANFAIAGIYTTAATLAQCTFDLGANPEIIPALR